MTTDNNQNIHTSPNKPDGSCANLSKGKGKSKGVLAICATPIGNRLDITHRVVDTLESADIIYAEDTRVTRKLLEMLGISANVQRCDENTTQRMIPKIVDDVASGLQVAFVSDAGMPCISDPGQRVVSAVRQAGLPVTVMPGASAVATAVAGCGFVCSSFYFGGFFPRKAGERKRLLQSLANLDSLLVFYESNHRTISALRAIAEVFPNRCVCMARELTKIHEEYLVGLPGELACDLESRLSELKGEIVLVIEQPKGRCSEGASAVCSEATHDGELVDPSANPDETNLDEQIRQYASCLIETENISSSKIAKRIQKEFAISREEAYKIACECKSDS